MTENTVQDRKPVYTIDLDDVPSWHRDNVAPWGSGHIQMSRSSSGSLEHTTPNGNTLIVALECCAPGTYANSEIDVVDYEVMIVEEAYLVKPDGTEFKPSDLIDRIEIKGYRRIWSGAYASIEDLDKDAADWITAIKATELYKLAPATVRQAINRAIDRDGGCPNWARKSGRDWEVKRKYAEAAWGAIGRANNKS